MFSFHKPRVYRSAEGCCICRAKSSSSRFTDSKKYADDSVRCFNLRDARHGEICNACVLLVKRFKRLPPGSNRHWGHVVDARAGPGMKSMTKFKKLKDDCTQASTSSSADRVANNQKSLIPEKFSKIFKKNKKKVIKEKPKPQNIAVVASKQWESQSLPLPLTPESLDSDCEEVQYSHARAIESVSLKIRQAINHQGSNKRKCLPPKRFRNSKLDHVQFFDENVWIKRKSCCGIVFENKEIGAIIIDIENYTPCAEHQRKKTEIPAKPPLPVVSQLSTPQQFNIKPTSYQLPFNPPASRNHTPVLKKHHLFYKRQSESFPLGDIKQSNHNNNNHNNINNANTSASSNVNANSNTHNKNNNNNTNNPPKTEYTLDYKVLPNSLPTSSAVKIAKLNPVDLHNSHLQITQCKMVAPFDHQAGLYKSNSKTSTFMHKIKPDNGKIVKHSFEKFNTIRLKPSEITDVKNLIKTTDKPFLIKPVSAIHQDKIKKLCLENVSCSTGQSVGTKFNDNSSDSGFDENLQDRKSVSPLQQDDCEKKLPGDMNTLTRTQMTGSAHNVSCESGIMADILSNTRNKAMNGGNTTKCLQLKSGHQHVRALYGQSTDGAIITTASSAANIIAIPSKTSTGTSSSSCHLTKQSTNIILNSSENSSNVLSTSVPSLNQKIILVKTKYNNSNINNQSVCKN